MIPKLEENAAGTVCSLVPPFHVLCCLRKYLWGKLVFKLCLS